MYTTAGWGANDFPEKRAPALTDLDVIAQDRPIVVYASRGRVHVNTRASSALGITRDTAVIAKVVVGRDAAGNPDGVLSGSPANVLSGFASTALPNTTRATSCASPSWIGTARISASCA